MKTLKNILVLAGLVLAGVLAAQPPWDYNPTSVSHSIYFDVDSVEQEIEDNQDIYPFPDHLKTNIYFDSPVITDGDYLGVFYTFNNQEYCAGYIKWNTADSLLKVFGFDNYNNGYKPGDNFYFKIWNSEQNCIYDRVNVIFETDTAVYDSGIFSIDGESRLKTIIIEPNAIIYPKEEYCNTEKKITPIYTRSFENISFETKTGLDLENSTGVFYPETSVPGEYIIKISTDFCIVQSDYKITIHPKPVIELGSDVDTCANNFILKADDENLSYEWPDGSSGLSYSTDQSKIVWVKATNDSTGCVARDTVDISLRPVPEISLGPDIYICDHNPYTFRIKNTYRKMLWSDGSTADTLQVKETSEIGIWVVNDYGCIAADDVKILFKVGPSLDLGKDTIICDSEFILSPDTVYSKYFWSTGETEKDITVSESGTYWLEVYNKNWCPDKDSVYIKFSQLDMNNYILSTEKASCNEAGKLIIDDGMFDKSNQVYQYKIKSMIDNAEVANIPDSSTLLYDHEVFQGLKSIKLKEGIYEFWVTDPYGCMKKWDGQIEIEKDCMKKSPIFTPNNDGDNDDYLIEYKGKIRIYDKYGRLIRQLYGPAYWDGTDEDGNAVPMGLYKILDNSGKYTNITIVK